MKKKTKKKVKPNKDVFHFYNIKPFNSQIIFFYSDNSNKLTEYLNKKENKDISKWLHKQLDKVPVGNETDMGFLSYNEDTQRPLVLFIKRPKKINWELYETMIHEITHLVQHLESYFAFEDEQEFRAWLTESIFKDLRKLI